MTNQSLCNEFGAVLCAEFGSHWATLIDVGAAGGIDPRWRAYAGLLKTVGFEPSKSEFEKLRSTESETWINSALSSKAEKRLLHLTKDWQNSSLHRPNQALLDSLEWGDGHAVVAEEELDCLPLDEVLQPREIDPDFLKIDTQGTELEILKGALGSLDRVVSVEVEVEFCELYQNQPLFADVDSFLRAQGFYLQDLGNVLYVKPRSGPLIGGPKGRIISADALYFRDPASAPELAARMSPRKAAAHALAFAAYGYPELGCVAIDYLTRSNLDLGWTATAGKLLGQFRNASKRLAWLPGKTFLARVGRKMWQNLYDFRGSLWDSPLGNSLK